MDIDIIKGELDQLKDELQITENAHKSLTGLLNMLEKQSKLFGVGGSLTKEEDITLSDVTEDTLWVAKLSKVNKTDELLRKHSTPLEYKELKRRG